MFHILGFTFIFLLVILIIGLGLIASFVRNICGLKKQSSRYQQANSSQKACHSTQEEAYQHANKKKIFSKDEGEYVDFEEV